MSNEFEDETLQCRDCEKDFTFTIGEQEFFKEKGFENKPTRCQDCKQIKKRERNDREGGGRRYGERSYGRDDRRGGGDRYGGREDRYGGRDDRRERPRGCFNCSAPDHMSRDCDQPRRERDNTCRQYKSTGECRYGTECRFVH
jgi:hypothetical protein